MTVSAHPCSSCHQPHSDSAEWKAINTAPKDGTWFWGMRGLLAQRTQWGKTSHVPLYGWCFIRNPDEDDPDFDLWEPTHWQPLEMAAHEGALGKLR